ncbi:MAG: hypothetical protein C9355_04840 [Thalassolituus maritimus]|nr:MAG: hypothetical protein C9355_04840 [Thalassolituus maritimus]
MKLLSRYRCLTLLIVAFTALLTYSGLAYAVDASASERIISGSGVSGISTQVRQLAEDQLTEHSGSEKRDRLRRLLPWSPVALQTSFTQLLESFTDEEVARLLEIVDDSLMARGRLMEDTALQEQGTPEYERYMQRLATYPPAVSRVQRVERLVSVTRMAEWLIHAQASVSDALELELSQGYEAQTRDAVLDFMLYAYRRVSNAEVDALTRLWNDAVMQRWLTEAFAALPDPARPESAEPDLI